ncbi:hypothetical protein PPYR_05226 [Photinus pyralis]|uniref:DUF4773 domain-containing protein n=1 Tax=Photinus pyralis TaxID=7054 RepID=A0A5N4AU22_PHOPY|nr:nucleolin-like [Photinus pyralis]KAB0800872.1 hypothetical protein PPYR_05226 [Photinus pyralis]
MRLSLIFELLLIFVLLAFAASRVIDSKGLPNNRRYSIRKSRRVNHKVRQDVSNYCNCSTKLCNCCRDFNFPVVSVRGPGCATLQYLQGDRLAVSLSFGERVLSNTTISGRKPKPICMQLPGGVSKFCGRVYGITREGEDFKACLGLELRALQDIEASLRVSCFRFGPKGLKVEPAQQLPVVNIQNNKDKDEDDDDDDDDDDDEYDFDDDDDEYDNDVDAVDYTGFSVFDDDFVGDLFGVETESESNKVKKPTPVKKVPVAPTKAPLKSRPSKPLIKKSTVKPLVKATTAKPVTKVTFTPTVTSTGKPVTDKHAQGTPENVAEKLPTVSQQPTVTTAAVLLQNLSDISSAKPASVELTTVSAVSSETSAMEVTTFRAETSSTPPQEDEEDNSTEVVENLIIKDGEDDADDDDEDDDPISAAVEDVLGEGSDSSVKNKTVTAEGNSEKVVKPQHSEDVVDEIVDGMVDTLTGEDSEKVPKKDQISSENKNKREKDDDDEYDDDEEDDDDR